jgi:hypothetical protein
MLVDFTISGTAAAAGVVVAYLQSTNVLAPVEGDWIRAHQLAAQTPVADNVATIAGSFLVTPVRAKLYPIEIEYVVRAPEDAANIIRIPIDLGYGGSYRLQVRAAGAAGLSAAAAGGTLPTLAISVSLQ